VPTAAVCLLVATTCWAGAVLGSSVIFPKVGAAVLFLPYAIVTWALLGTRPAHWWALLLAAAVGSYGPHRAGASITFVLLAEGANQVRAVVAAAGMRRFGLPSRRLQTLREMSVFLLFAGVLAPMGGAFLGAGVVAWHHGLDRYWPAWQAWLLSNALTGLTVLMPLLTVGRPGGWTWPSRRRALEGAALGAGLLLTVGVLTAMRRPIPGVPLELYGPLPFLLWAGVRFGPRGTGATLLALSGVMIGAAVAGRGPFVEASPDDNVLHLQLFLIVMSLPLLLLSALMAQQRNTVEALLASEERYRTVIEDQTDLVCRFRADGAVTFANGAFCRWVGLERDVALGRSFWLAVPRDRRAGAGGLISRLTAARPVGTWEQETMAGGDRRWQHWTVRGLFDGRQRIIDYQAVGRDITEHRLLLAQSATADALREADRNKDQFLALLAHELRNPLAPLTVVADILNQVPLLEENLRLARDVLGRQVGQLTHLVNDLLDVARISTGKIRLQLARLDLNSVIAQAVETCRPLIVARAQQLVLELPAPPLAAIGDRTRLAQLISNLLENAAKYTAPGGRIVVRAGPAPGGIVLSVKDNGVGLPEHMRERVFEPFVQVAGTYDQAGGGLGLGLSLVKQVAGLHGGTVTAHSDGPGRGSEFVVRLPEPPAEAPGAAAAASGSRPAATRPQSRRILVVDDAVDGARALTILLELQGHRVRMAHDGPAALRVAAELDPEVVLLDLGLPGMDGLEVATRLRERPNAAAMLLVAVTGFGQAEDRRRTAEVGFDHHLVKPIDPVALRVLLATGGLPRLAAG
jgi:PAS domain S-box-containing protein